MRRKTLWDLLVTTVLTLAVTLVAPTVRADTYTVTNSSDSGAGSLREAILASNGHDGPDRIAFGISGSDVHTITLESSLPVLVDDATTIDGYTQRGAFPASDTSAATLRIVIDGNQRTVDEALRVTSASNVIRGLVIANFSVTGIVISGSGATSNTVSGNYIGTDVTGTNPRGNASSGVTIEPGAHGNRIGGDAPSERNIISGNLYGVSVLGSGAMSNTVSGNYIGTDASGTSALGNAATGVSISGGAENNTVGGCTPGERNLISGNHGNGVSISDNETTGNSVVGNHIGPDVSGTAALYNLNHGVYIYNGAHDNTVGGGSPGAGNLISGNSAHGIAIGGQPTGAYRNTVSGNYIGVDTSAASALGNTLSGVAIRDGAHSNTVGGDTPEERNVISGNDKHGLLVEGEGTANNTVSGNYIGPSAGGTSVLGNGQYGVYIQNSARDNTIGGNIPAKGNVIAGSYYDGVLVYGHDTTGNTISGNSIHHNGGSGISLLGGGNTELAPPVIANVTAAGASGTGCTWCTIHVYSDENDEGEVWHAPPVVADASGSWTYDGTIYGPYLTATGTDSNGNTSEFSASTPVLTVYLPLVVRS